MKFKSKKFNLKGKKQGFIYTVLTTSIISLILVGYFLLSDIGSNDNFQTKSEQNSSKKVANLLDYNHTVLAEHNKLIERMKDILDKELAKDENITEYSNSEATDYLNSLKNKDSILLNQDKSNEEKINQDLNQSLPKLAIIIDDVAYKSQIKKIRDLGFPITPSFFPSDKNHKYTKNYAQNEQVVMVHLPLEALNYANEEINTLKTYHSKGKIDNRIREIKKDFPNITFINNHTGSKFTSNYRSMKYLLEAMKRENIIFLDSVTTHDTKVFYVARDVEVPYLKRDIFLDNIQEVNYILRQFQKAVKIAKSKGQAVAIAHPHRKTFEALKKIKPLLDGVKLVYINEINPYVTLKE